MSDLEKQLQTEVDRLKVELEAVKQELKTSRSVIQIYRDDCDKFHRPHIVDAESLKIVLRRISRNSWCYNTKRDAEIALSQCMVKE